MLASVDLLAELVSQKYTAPLFVTGLYPAHTENSTLNKTQA